MAQYNNETHLKIGKSRKNTENSEVLGWEVEEVDSLNVDQHLEGSKSEHSCQIHDTECYEENSRDIFSLFLDKEEKSEAVSEDPNHCENEIDHKQNVLRISLYKNHLFHPHFDLKFFIHLYKAAEH